MPGPGRRFTKGRSGNPAGRPRRGQALAEMLRAELDKPGADGRSRGERIAAKLVELAEGGDVRAIRECYDRVLGKAPQTFRLAGSAEFDPTDGLEGISKADEAEVAAAVEHILGTGAAARKAAGDP